MNIEVIDNLTDRILKKASGLSPDDISVITTISEDSMLRFSNNSMTVVDTLKEVVVFLYLTKAGKRCMGATYTINPNDLDDFVDKLFTSMKFAEKSKDYVPLPKITSRYETKSFYDVNIERLGEKIADHGVAAMNAALKEGARRVSGAITSSTQAYRIRTSGGVEAFDQRSSITINVRAFSDTGSSGHGLSCSASLADFNAEEAGATAGRLAWESKKTGHWEEGEYDLIMGPTVAANMLQMVGHSASAFHVDAGTSFFVNSLDKKVASEEFTLEDYGVVEGGFGGRVFDDEGVPTQRTSIIERGILRTYLHNSSTAKKYDVKTTGNAGIVVPHPWNLVAAPGDMSVETMIAECKRAIYVTNNWYTRYQNYVKGEYSTLPRDATFLVENGSIKYAINGTRISDSVPRQLLNLKGIGKERKWVEWWEVEIPTNAPALLIEKARITKAQL
ncbi:MAG: TldD/PmbA family protein [Nitrososphaeria archaeon]